MNNGDETGIFPESTVEQGVQNEAENNAMFYRRITSSTTDQRSEAALLSAGSSTTTMDSQDDPKVQYKSAEEVLTKLGQWNPRLLLVSILMASVWGITAFPIMITAFAVKPFKCPDNDTDCLEDVKRYHTIADEFPGSEVWIEGFSSFYFIGNMIFGSIISCFADLIGRRYIVIIALFLTGLFGCLAAFSRSLVLLLLFRFLQGSFYTPAASVSWVLASESICFKAHARTSMVFGLFWVLGYCLVALISYLFPNWHNMMLVSSMPALVFSLIFCFTVPESFCFLVENGRKQEVSKWIQKYDLKKNVNCDVDSLLNSTNAEDSHNQSHGVIGTMNYFKQHKIYVFYLITASALWAFDFLVYNGMSLFSTSLVGNPYLNHVLAGAVEIPAYLFAPQLMNRIGRKKTVIASHFFTTLSLLPLTFIKMENKFLYVSFWLLGKLGTSISFLSLFVYGSELFPTSIKNTCIGIASMFGNLGGICAYQSHSLANIYPGLPMILFSSLSLVGGLVIFLFPETATHRLLTEN
uniref:Major facilitator superfamily (MFS) profile domain-containing protein n=1 Tax=Panagrolaimus sp. JU765 TaxID=591449 RepID=A0AC34QBN7_9BILA